MKRKKYYVALFIAAFIAALAIQAPATLLGVLLARRTGGSLVLAQPTGTVWSGTATPVVNLKSAAPLRLGRVTWDISLRTLWRGVILLRVRENDVRQKQPAEILLSPSQADFRNFSMELPAAAMGGLDPLLQAMHFQGRLVISANSIVLGRDGAVTGAAVANWEMAGSDLSPVNPFGTYRLRLTGEGNKVGIVLSTESGCLELNGQGEWRAGTLAFEASATATGKSKGALRDMLHHLGPETAPGVFSFRLNR
ncbi:MAG TPA: type II secretion system protein N [Gallionellaceae bacterium]|nr:type II secretion system protein N [Gallionellaceae bacterium]